jgi:hypothetical protein
MKWDTLKKRVVKHVADVPDHPGSQYIQTEADAKKLTVAEYLDTIDIRRVGALREHVPGAFPFELRGRGMLHANKGEHGEWEVTKAGSR